MRADGTLSIAGLIVSQAGYVRRSLTYFTNSGDPSVGQAVPDIMCADGTQSVEA
jgi:hypothetical protein